jgi:hypothetical protein
LLVGAPVFAVGPIPLTAASGGFGVGGEFTASGTVPATIVPGVIAFQAFTLDAAAPLGFATSNGVQMKVL